MNGVDERATTPTIDEPSDHTAGQRRPIRSYVLRQGRLSDAQKRYLRDWSAGNLIANDASPINWAHIFGAARSHVPRIVEIGCGMGETTATIAALHPNCNYLGIEVHSPGVANLLHKIATTPLHNLRLLQADAHEVFRQRIDAASLDGIHLFFPDPWPKKRHHKRRLLQADFAHLLADKLKPGGYLHCATDWQDYAVWMQAILLATRELTPSGQQGIIDRPALQVRPLTKFEQRGLKLGYQVWDLMFVRATV